MSNSASTEGLVAPASDAIKRPNWTKVHLIYFALAAIDLLAVCAGLWLSYHTRSEFERSVSKFEVADLMRDNAVAVWGATLRLGGPANEVFSHRDVVKARAEFQAASEQFMTALAGDHFDEESEQRMEEAAEHAAGGHEHGAHEHGGLEIWFPEAFATFEGLEQRIQANHTQLRIYTEATLEAFAKGDMAAATQAMDLSDAALFSMLESLRSWVALADSLNDETVEDSIGVLEFGELMQYVIGAAIFLMVALIVIYAHFMGKLLRRKFEEIEAARDSSKQFADRLLVVNDDVSKLNTELSENMKRLSQAQDEILKKGRMEQLGHLTATVAHELRNPLGAVRTSSFLLERKIANKGLGVESQLQRIQNGVVRCDNIITQLLDFSRSNAASLAATDLDSWLLKIVEQEAQGLPAAVEIEFSPGLAGRAVDIDEARLSRAVINLVSNAAEAMVGKGDDPSKFTTPTPRIAIETGITVRGVEIRVRDNGPGISADDLPRILEPLFTTKNFGTGLGLPAVQRILEQHGGGLDVQSEFGKGACFTAWLPLERGEMKAA
jgi:signal transduction histidine kinase